MKVYTKDKSLVKQVTSLLVINDVIISNTKKTNEKSYYSILMSANFLN